MSGLTVFNTQEVETKKQPMFFGQPLGVQRYDGSKYPVFEKLTQQQLGYFWRPEEVSLQKDRSDYQNLTEEQKHIFTSNLKYQIMLDSVQGRAPGMAFAPYCSLPELEACMNVWQFMEMIHSRSYTYIIKNVYSDPAEVFDTILKDEKILERAESVTSSYDDFVNDAHEYDSGNLWKYAVEGHPTGTYDRHELKRKLYRAIANVNILEGIRFYVSFACSFAFGELKLMEGSAKIISLISRDENQHVVVTQQILNKWNEGDDPEMKQIAVGGACPRWNVYSAFKRPGVIQAAVSKMTNGEKYVCIARTVEKGIGRYGQSKSILSIGLGCEAKYAKDFVYTENIDTNDKKTEIPVGVSCRTCDRLDCSQRAFPPLHKKFDVDINNRGVSVYVNE